MATENLNKMQQLSVKYNVSFQPIYSEKALASGNLKSVHKAIIGGHEYNKLCQLNNKQLEELFKQASMGKVMDTGIVFNNNRVSINGNRYDILEVIKGVEINSLLQYLKNDNDYSDYIKAWLLKDIKNITDYLHTIDTVMYIPAETIKLAIKLECGYFNNALMHEWLNKEYIKINGYELAKLYTFEDYINRDNYTVDDIKDDLKDYSSLLEYACDIWSTLEDESTETVYSIEKKLREFIGV